MNNQIQMIPVKCLRHHPDNPRKDLGDLTELADSIKANGILQNLTVVPCDSERETDQKDHSYKLMWVVIGNRRFEAAQIAGLKELPCVVSDMDHKTQVSTMLTENMQRADLTAYEQAEGFQMMMDLGFTEKQISEKTGFSQKTVKDRIKLTKLDKKEFGNATDRGANLMEMIEITKLKDKEAQEEMLQYAGTDNFKQKMMAALQKQKRGENRERLEPVLKEFMEEVPEDDQYTSKWSRLWAKDFGMSRSAAELSKHIKKEIMTDSEGKYGYGFIKCGDGSISFFLARQQENKDHKLTGEEKTQRQLAIERGRRVRNIQGFWRQAYDLRTDFVKNFEPNIRDGYTFEMLSRAITKRALDKTSYGGEIPKNHEWNDAYIREVLGLPEKPIPLSGHEQGSGWAKGYKTIWQQIDGKQIPLARILLAWAVGGGLYWPDGPEHGLYDSEGNYRPNSGHGNGVDDLYDFLMEIGYPLSDMERELLHGTHECYQTKIQEENKDVAV